MVEQWISTSWTTAGLIALSTVTVFAAVVTYVRIVGLRSFSKLSSFDFAMTVAVGSLMASVAVVPSVSLANGLIALAVLFGVQFVIALLRRTTRAERWVDNSPRLLMAGDRFVEHNLKTARVTRRDVLAKLRENNVVDRASVLAVVLETTGDISVMHGRHELDPELLDGVLGADQIAGPSSPMEGQSNAGSTSSR